MRRTVYKDCRSQDHSIDKSKLKFKKLFRNNAREEEHRK